MKICFLLVILVWVFFFTPRIHAGEIGFIEDFALAKDRAAVLKQLIPGTTDYYFYHCLHAQHTGDYAEVRRLLELWIKRDGYSPQVKEMLNRQALLEYSQHPEKSLEHIRNTLGLQFDHQKEQTRAESKSPTSLDSHLISEQRLSELALSRYQNLEGFEDSGLAILDPGKLNPDQRRNFLQRLQRPDIPGLAKLVVDDLRHEHSGGFGSHTIHTHLLKSQMEECAKLMPELLDNPGFVALYLTRLAPDDDTDAEYDPDEKKAYLRRMWEFVRPLAPVHNSLKTHLLYHILDTERKEGNYDSELFLTYIQLPRPASYMNPEYLRSKEMRDWTADLNTDYSPVTGHTPVAADEELVRDYLSHFFVTAPDTKTYEKYIRKDWLQEVFATAKILNGVGDMEQWYSIMNPDRYRDLKERVDIDFALVNKTCFTADEPVSLEMDIKNVKTLMVKVFELNTFNYYRKHMEEVDAAVNLDGLTATWETVYNYDDAPLRRIRRKFDFPDLNRPGVFVLEFIGGGKSSRAVIRKGKLHFVSQITAAGHAFRVLDEKNEFCPHASLWISGHEYKADEDGIITVPFSTSPGMQTVILRDTDQCSLAAFQHVAEHWQLSAGFFADRESLIKRQKSKVLIRPFLTVAGYPASPEILEEVRLRIETKDIEGVASSKEFTGLTLSEEKESVYEFQVPENLSSIAFSLSAKVKNISQNRKDTLETSAAYTINSIDETEAVRDMYLSRTDKGYFLEILGKNGEAVPDRPVQIECQHRFFRDSVHTVLQSDAKGRIQLGDLKDIAWIKAENTENLSHTWQLYGDRCRYPAHIHQTEGQTIRIPYMGNPAQEMRKICSLLEKRGEMFAADRADSIRMTDGFLEITGLAPGNYDLVLKESGTNISLKISKGALKEDFIVSQHRILETGENTGLQISKVESSEKQVNLTLGGVSEETRVHVLGLRFLPDFHPFPLLVRTGIPEPWEKRLSSPISQYQAGRSIGDEYRYILDRKYAQQFPGNMLPRPELLLNPRSVRKTGTAVDSAQAGEALRSEKPATDAFAAPAPESSVTQTEMESFHNPDFLAQPSAVLCNLRPDEKGRVSIKREELGNHSHICIVAADSLNTVFREIFLPEKEMQTRDLRMVKSPDSAKHLTEQKEISLFAQKQTFHLQDISTSSFEIYDSLEKVYNLLLTLSNDSKLREFRFILKWPEMTKEEKEEKYGQYACHELNFFLFHKDRAFFDAVILPYLTNKKEKTFADLWLTDGDIRAYTEPRAFSRLNIAEKILLLRSMPGDAQNPDPVKRYVKDLFDMIPPDTDNFNRVFDTAVKGSALDDSGTVAQMIGAVLDDSEADNLAEPMPAEESLSYEREAVSKDMVVGMARPAPAPSVEGMKMKMAAPSGYQARAISPEKKGAGRRRQDMAKREAPKPFFRKLDKTEEWAENNWHGLSKEEQNADLITVNAFWNDYAQSDPSKPFISGNFPWAAKNFSEMMLVLSFMDLPFASGKQEMEIKELSLSLHAASPLIVFHKEIKEAEPVQEPVPMMISQNFFRTDDRYRYENNEKSDKFVRDEFLFRTPYGCQVVLSNPSSARQKLRVLLRIPDGAMPLQKGFYTRGISLNLEPFSTRQMEYYFYFPETGEFPLYPAQVAENEKFITAADAFSFHVVKELTSLDTQSWEYISQNGDNGQVLDFIRHNNPHRLSLEKIAFRMKDKKFFTQSIALLHSLHLWNDTLWSYGIFHNLPEIAGEYINRSAFADQCGFALDSPLLKIRPADRDWYEHLEYRPLVNARAHQLGKERKILNDRFFEQYQRFMKKLIYQPGPEPDDLMSITYYLLLQDRTADAMDFFVQADPAKLSTSLQYDYLHAYLDFCKADTASARSIAEKYSTYPVPRWRKFFAAALAQLDELQGKNTEITDEKDRDQVQAVLADAEKAFEFKVESGQIHISYRNIKECRISYYPMDIELLFSRSPFVRQDTEYFTFIRPNRADDISLPEKETQYTMELPQEFGTGNLMIQMESGPVKKSQVVYANSLDAQIAENYGILSLREQKSGKAIAGAYVKVFARMKDGSVQFYKDGYTDLRGKFDYVSLSTDESDNAERYAILVLTGKNGAVIKEAGVPKQ
ncbi:MAG: hypothetical protein AB7S75_15845 [Desulfococcaceae bacterium]